MKINYYIRKYFKYIFAIIFLSFLRAILSFISPILVKKILDSASLYNKSGESIFKYFILFFIALLCIYSVDFILSKIKLVFSFIFKTQEQKILYEELLEVKYESFYKNGASYYVYRISQFINELFMTLSSYLSSVLISAFTIVVSLFFLFKGSFILFFVGLILLPLNYFGYKKINYKLLEKSKILQEKSASNFNEIINFVSNFETIKQFLNFGRLIKILGNNFENIENAHNDINVYAQKTSLLLSFIIDFFKNFILMYLIYLFWNGNIYFSDLIFLNMIFSVYTSGLSELNKININLRDLKVGLHFVKEDILKHKERNEGKLQLNQVNSIDINLDGFRYDKKLAIDSINLSFKSGKKYAIVGNSGCGKSTLVKLLVRLYESNGISINGKEINEYSLKTLRNKIFLLPHTPQVFPVSIKQNILIGAEDSEIKRYKNLTDMSFLKEISDKHDFETTIISSGVNLSNGEKQAICAARVFIKNPDIIIFDEATSAMDSRLEDLFVKDLENIKDYGNKTFIFISHRLSTIKKCDEIIFMENKKIGKIFRSYADAICDEKFVKLYESQLKAEKYY